MSCVLRHSRLPVGHVFVLYTEVGAVRYAVVLCSRAALHACRSLLAIRLGWAHLSKHSLYLFSSTRQLPNLLPLPPTLKKHNQLDVIPTRSRHCTARCLTSLSPASETDCSRAGAINSTQLGCIEARHWHSPRPPKGISHSLPPTHPPQTAGPGTLRVVVYCATTHCPVFCV